MRRAGFTLKHFVNKGFTLIEIVVAMGLVVLFMGLGSVNFQQANKRQQVDQSTEKLRQAFRQAKSNALAGKKDCLVCGAAGGVCGAAGDTPLSGWRVVVTANSFAVQGECGANVFGGRTESLPVGVTMSPLVSPLFRPLSGGTDLSGSVTMRVTGGNIEESFILTSPGELLAIAAGTPAATATGSPPTATPAVSSPTPTRTPTPAPTITATRIKDMTFEAGSLTGSDGADSIAGTVSLDAAFPLKGGNSATFPDAPSSYLREDVTAVDDIYVSFYLRLNGLPPSSNRIAYVTDSGSTTVGALILSATGTLTLRNGSTAVGSPSAVLGVGSLYRVGLRQKAGTGSNAILEAYLAAGDAAFGAPFASNSTQSFVNPAIRVNIGPNTGSTNFTVDNVRVDSGSMPGPL